jgi:calnexin
MVRALLTCSLIAGAVLASNPAFQDQFVDGQMNWTPSAAKKVVDGVTDEALLQYRGEWSVEESTVWQGIVGDHGLVAKTAAAHHVSSFVRFSF